MSKIIVTLLFAVIWWGIFYNSFRKDRSRYRNCYLLAAALLSLIPLAIQLSGPHADLMISATFFTTSIVLLIVPFFLIINGIVMIRKEGRSMAHLLSLGLGIVVLIGEALTFYNMFYLFRLFGYAKAQEYYSSDSFLVQAMIIVTVIYGSLSFVIFMFYSLFLMIIPRNRDFDYVIIHGAGLLQGSRISKLLQDRLDKAIEVYRSDPSATKLIPSGGKGSDEDLSEAEAMKGYLLEQGIPESDIILEDRSTTTLENLQFSKDIIDSFEGRKYTALVTSNYHVYRALRYCRRVGLKCKGIGSRVAFYFWPSALIREYIAVHTEKKHAASLFLGWVFWMILTVMIIKAN